MSDATMNNHTVEGLRAQRDALLGALKASKQTIIYKCRPTEAVLWSEVRALIATIEGLPKAGVKDCRTVSEIFDEIEASLKAQK